MGVKWDPLLGALRTTDSSSGGGGQTLYTVVVDSAGGGDYTTVTAALSAASSGQTIFVRAGSYSESGGSYSTANLTIRGEGQGSTTLTLSNNLTLSGSGITIKDITINTNGKGLTLSGNDSVTDGCHIQGSTAFFFTTGLYSCIVNNFIEATSTSGRVKLGQRSRTTGNHFIVPHISEGGIFLDANSAFSGNMIYGHTATFDTGTLLTTWGERCAVTGNSFFCRPGPAFSCDSRCTFSGNAVYQSGGKAVTIQQGCTATGNIIHHIYSGSGIYINGSGYSAVVTGNTITTSKAGSGTTDALWFGIELGFAQVGAVISGNSIASFGTGVLIPSGATDTIVTNNSIQFANTDVDDSGTGTIIDNNTS